MDKRDRAGTFRLRVEEAMTRQGLSRSDLARHCAVDRSTIGQLLTADDPRLPNAHLAAEMAAALGVSCDWLLGLTERPERPGDLLASAMVLSDASRTVADQQILDWHKEAEGYKIRHVPATLPDMMKTRAMLDWEYAAFTGKSPDQAEDAMDELRDFLLQGRSDYEIAVPLHEFQALAQGSGYYADLPADIRADQLHEVAGLCDDTFPALRLFLFDAKTVYSAPLTVFGPLLAALYVGQVYLAFRSTDRVRALTRHFDMLVRDAAIDARDAAAWLRALPVR